MTTSCARRKRRASRSRPPTRSTVASSTATASATPARTLRRPPSPAKRWCSASSTAASPRARSSCPTTPRWVTSKSTTASPRPSTRSSAALEKNGTLANFQVDAGPENVGVAADMNDPANSIISLIESRGDVVGAFAGNNVFTPALASAVAQTGNTGKMCAYGFDLGPAQQEALSFGRPDRCSRSAAVPSGLLAGHAALPDDRPRHCRREPRHARPARDQRHRRHGWQPLRELGGPTAPCTVWALRGRTLSRSAPLGPPVRARLGPK